MQTIIKAYDKFWFLIGLGFIVLGFSSPQEYWFLVILIPLISGLILLSNRYPIPLIIRKTLR